MGLFLHKHSPTGCKWCKAVFDSGFTKGEIHGQHQDRSLLQAEQDERWNRLSKEQYQENMSLKKRISDLETLLKNIRVWVPAKGCR